jgi:5-methyltetrahydrofolate--homocysteine methyltransferase
MAINVRFGPQDWARIERDWNAWWAGELQRPLVVLEVVDPVPGADWSQLTKFGLDTPVDEVIDNWQRIFEATHYLGDAYPKWWVNFGPGTMAAFLGSRVSWEPDTTWFWPLEGVDTLREIHPVYDAGNPWWLRVQAMTRRAAERWGDQVLVGMTDLGGNLDILAALRGSQKLLLDLSDDPHTVERLAGEITQLWLRYFRELEVVTRMSGRGSACWGPVWSPKPGYMLQCDFAYMISPRMFKRFVMPDLTACCDFLDYGFYHLDGIGELPHLDQLIGLERLRGIQWQPGDGQPKAEGWLEVIAKIRDSGKRCQIYVTRAGALAVQKAIGGKGFLMHIVDDPMTVEEGKAFLTELDSL